MRSMYLSAPCLSSAKEKAPNTTASGEPLQGAGSGIPFSKAWGRMTDSD